QEIVRELRGIDGARPEVEPLEELRLALARAVRPAGIELVVPTARLGFAPLEEWSERPLQVLDAILVLVREEHSPPDVGERGPVADHTEACGVLRFVPLTERGQCARIDGIAHG